MQVSADSADRVGLNWYLNWTFNMYGVCDWTINFSGLNWNLNCCEKSPREAWNKVFQGNHQRLSPNASSQRIWTFFLVEMNFVELFWILVGAQSLVNISLSHPTFSCTQWTSKVCDRGVLTTANHLENILVANLLFHHATFPTFFDPLTTMIDRPCLDDYFLCIFFFFAFWKVHRSDSQWI